MLRFKNNPKEDQSRPMEINFLTGVKLVNVSALDGCELEHVENIDYAIKSGAHAGWFIRNLSDSWIERIPDDIAQADHLSGQVQPKSKYHRPCKGVQIDVYDVLVAFTVTDPAIAHAVKKLLAPGQRGSKGWAQDVEEAIKSCQRALEMHAEAQG